jgi:hypothetical protein
VEVGSTGGPVTGASVSVSVSGVMTETTPCSSTCLVDGGAGTYRLEVGAPGFQTALRTVMVPGNKPSGCDCGTAIVQHLDVALVPSR